MCRVHGSRSKFKVQVPGSRVEGLCSRFRVQGLGSKFRLRVQGPKKGPKTGSKTHVPNVG